MTGIHDRSNLPCWGDPLLTANERRAKVVLDQVLQHRGSLILPGYKLSQVIRRRPSEISSEQWNYATRAHFDFVVCSQETYMPEFAVELDDASHNKADARRRDRIKDALCEAAGFELLRIDSRALDKGPHGQRLVEYLIEARDYMRAFGDAQEQGHVPFDEIGDFRMILGPGGFVNDLAAPARLQARRMLQAGRVQGHMIDSIHFGWRSGWSEAWAWLHTHADFYLFERTRLRSYRFRCGIGPGELAEDLAVAAVGRQLPRLAGTAPILVRRRNLEGRLAQLLEQRSELDDALMIDQVQFQGIG
jgi:very-short-patch-repair endonuclease